MTRRVAGRSWILALGILTSGCTRDLWRVTPDARAVAFTTGGWWSSMIYLARTDSGVIAIDLGWVGAEGKLQKGLTRLHAAAPDVRYVFLTHAHRDHTYGWRYLHGARFVLGAAELPYFTSGARYRGLLPRIGDRLVSYPHPAPGELRLITLGSDSAFTLGSDTLVAFTVPGHTPGSMAYLFRGILFGGDAINWRPWTSFRGARPEFSDDVAQSRASMRALWSRLDSSRVRTACTAHAKCGVVDAAFRAATER